MGIFLNIIFVIISIWVIYLVITDDRFIISRKVLFIFLNLVLIIISVYISKTPYLIIKDLFWYTLILNGSFIFHVLILDRIFHWCWKNHYEYLGFIISRISFMLSLSCIIVIIASIWNKIIFYVSSFYLWDYWDDFKNDINKMKTFKYKYTKFYKLIIKPNKIYYWIFDYLVSIISNSIFIFRLILIHFITIFQNYSLILMGKSDKIFTLEVIIKHLIIFIIFFILAWIIGIPRLYIIWIFQGLIEIYKILNMEYEYQYSSKIEKYKISNFYDKLKYIINCKKSHLLINCHNKKYDELEKIYEKPYHIFFQFDLYKFLLNKYSCGLSWGIWGAEDTVYEDLNNKDLKYPILKIYEFYPWEEMAIGYCNAENLVFKDEYDDNAIRNRVERLKEGLDWCKWINRDHKFLIKIMPDILEEKDLPIDEKFLEKLEDSNYSRNIWLKNF